MIKDESLGDGLPLARDYQAVHLGIIVGHTAKAQGAFSKYLNMSEYKYNLMIAELVTDIQAKNKDSYPCRVTTIFRDAGGLEGAYRQARELGCDCVIELHFNAFNGQVRGSETLTTFDGQDLEFSRIIHAQICAVFNRTELSRGVKAISRSNRGGINVHLFPDGPNCLVEPFFGDSELDSALADKVKLEYAEAILKGVCAWARAKQII